MNDDSEEGVMERINGILKELALEDFTCEKRKSMGDSVINKPVDLQIRRLRDDKIVCAIEVANVNSPQLVGETCRLYYDKCPIKLLVLGDRNVPPNGVELCSKLMARLYGQDYIQNTPARVVKYDDDENIKAYLRDLLLI